MAVCGAGTGVPKHGMAALQVIGPVAVAGLLSKITGWQGAAVAAAVGTVTYDPSTFCPAGPGAMPTFTLDDIVALLSPFPLPGYQAAFGKMRDFVDNLVWPVICECSGGASTIPSPSTYPSGAPQTLPPTATSPICFTLAKGPLALPPATTPAYYWGTGTVTTTRDDIPIPPNATYATLTALIT